MSDRRTQSSARHRARESAFRVVYSADLAGDAYGHAWAQHEDRAKLGADQMELVDDVIRHLDKHGAEIDARLQGVAAHWPLERMSATDRSVLRVAVAELMSRAGTPARVVIDEAVEIAKRFGSGESGSFVNGILDRLARELRPGEF